MTITIRFDDGDMETMTDGLLVWGMTEMEDGTQNHTMHLQKGITTQQLFMMLVMLDAELGDDGYILQDAAEAWLQHRDQMYTQVIRTMTGGNDDAE